MKKYTFFRSLLALLFVITFNSAFSQKTTGIIDELQEVENPLINLNSNAMTISTQLANEGFSYDITVIGRDNNSDINKKQTVSHNNVVANSRLTQCVLAINPLKDNKANNQNISNSPISFALDRPFLVWGNNGANLNSLGTTISVNISGGISPPLTTNVSFTPMKRVWKIVENNNGNKIPKVKISVPQNIIHNITPHGNYYMFISNNAVFDTTVDFRLMTSDGNGNLTTEYEFDNTKYITFGYAPRVVADRSVYFDGLDDYIDMENSLNLNSSEFTISAWIKRESGSLNASIISKRDAIFSRGYDFKIDDFGKLQMLWKKRAVQSLTSITTIPENEWHHVAAIYNGTTLSLYIDGVFDSSANLSKPRDTSESFYIGAGGKQTPNSFFKGNIDEVRMWNLALSVNQLRYILNQEIENNNSFVSGRILPISITKNEVATIPWNRLDAYYPMSEFTFTNIVDASGNGNHGTLRNLNTVDTQTAPLPYESAQNGSWNTNTTWKNGTLQYIPGSTSIVNPTITIDWNIVKTTHNVDVDNLVLPAQNALNRTVLGLMVNSNKLTVNGSNSYKLVMV